MPGLLDSLVADRLLVVPGDRHEVLLSAALCEDRGERLAAVLLTAGIAPDPAVVQLCRPALEAGLPILLSGDKTFETTTSVLALDPQIPPDDEERAHLVMTTMAQAYDSAWLDEVPADHRGRRSTPAVSSERAAVPSVPPAAITPEERRSS